MLPFSLFFQWAIASYSDKCKYSDKSRTSAKFPHLCYDPYSLWWYCLTTIADIIDSSILDRDWSGVYRKICPVFLSLENL